MDMLNNMPDIAGEAGYIVVETPSQSRKLHKSLADFGQAWNR